MHTFKVWSPRARTVAVEIGGKSHQLEGSDGWWSGTIAEAGPGTEYWFIIDGGDRVPDPRSPWQPRGINGPSCLIDHSAFHWTDQAWQPRPLSSAIIYELHVGSFTPEGTFRSTAKQLDYLVDLGITHVELMPVNEF